MLHDSGRIRTQLEDDVFASSDLSTAIPKFRIPVHEHDPRHAYQLVHDELLLDGNSRQNLATFCQTWVEPEVHRLMDLCIDKNMTKRKPRSGRARTAAWKSSTRRSRSSFGMGSSDLRPLRQIVTGSRRTLE